MRYMNRTLKDIYSRYTSFLLSKLLLNIKKVNAESTDAEELFPVDITIKQFHRMKTFQLPTVERRGEKSVIRRENRN